MIENVNQVTRWNNGQKTTVFAESTPFGASRANEILRKTSMGESDIHMTDGEIVYTRYVWNFMDGNTCFNDALRRIAKADLPDGLTPVVNPRPCSTCSKPFTPDTDGVYECSTGCYYVQHGLWGFD